MSHQGFWLNKITGASSRAILPKKAKELIVKQICLNCGAIIKEEWRNYHKQCPYCGRHTLIKKTIVKNVERACGNHKFILPSQKGFSESNSPHVPIKMKNEEIKLKILEYRVRQARIWLEELGIKVGKEIKIDEATSTPYLPCSFKLSEDTVFFKFPITKLGRRFLKEIQTHLLKGTTCGTINENDAKTILLGLAKAPVIYKYRTRLRKATGLVKDRKLRNWLIWRRIKAKQMLRKE